MTMTWTAALALLALAACGGSAARMDDPLTRGSAGGSAGGAGVGGAVAGVGGVGAGGAVAGSGGAPAIGAGGAQGIGGLTGAGGADAGGAVGFPNCPVTGGPLRSTPCTYPPANKPQWLQDATGAWEVCSICTAGVDTTSLPCVGAELCVASCSPCVARP